MKRIVYACLDQMLHFDSREEFNSFIAQLKKDKRLYKIEEVTDLKDGTVNVHIKRQYNNSPFDKFLK